MLGEEDQAPILPTPPVQTGTDLLFEQASPASAHLVFGAGVAVTTLSISIVGTLPGLKAHLLMVPPVEMVLVGALPAPTLQLALRPSQPVRLMASLPGLTAVMEGGYFSNTQRPEVYQTCTRAELAQAIDAGVTPIQQHAVGISAAHVESWADGWRIGSAIGLPYREARPSSLERTSVFDEASRLPDLSLRAILQEGQRQSLGHLTGFAEANHHAALASLVLFEEGIRSRTDQLSGLFQDARQLAAFGYLSLIHI